LAAVLEEQGREPWMRALAQKEKEINSETLSFLGMRLSGGARKERCRTPLESDH